MNVYVPILVLGAIASAFAVVLGASLASWSVRAGTTARSSRPTSAESNRRRTPGGGGRFPVKYYLTAMLFIIFDIEIVFLYPWAVHFDALGVFGLGAMALFIFNVSVAYAYEWRARVCVD